MTGTSTAADVTIAIWTAGGFVAAAVVSGVFAIVVARISKKVDKAIVVAQEASNYAKPTGNGFAKEVKDSLARVELGQQEMRVEIGTLKEKVADQAVSHARLEGKLDGHLIPRQREAEKGN
jgi:hypothetical protein